VKYYEDHYNEPETRLLSKYNVDLIPPAATRKWYIQEEGLERILTPAEYSEYVKRSGELFYKAVQEYMRVNTKEELKQKGEGVNMTLPMANGEEDQNVTNLVEYELLEIRKKIMAKVREEMGIGGKKEYSEEYLKNKIEAKQTVNEVMGNLGYSSGGGTGFGVKGLGGGIKVKGIGGGL
jgi:hypothetical protein